MMFKNNIDTLSRILIIPQKKRELSSILRIKNIILLSIFFPSFLTYQIFADSSYVIHILVDGLASMHLKTVIDQKPEVIPNFMKLIRESTYTLNARTDYHSTETLPNTIDVITARPLYPENGMPQTGYHGFYYNYWVPGATIHSLGNRYPGYIKSIFDIVHDYGLKTALFGGKQKFDIIPNSYNEQNGAPDEVGEDNGRNKIDYWEILDWGYGLKTVPPFLEKMNQHKFNYTFLHIADLDFIGHYYGWDSPSWIYQLSVVDSYLGEIFSLIENNEDFAGKTTVIITADHGGGVPATSHIHPEYQQNYMIPIFIWGPGWEGGRDLYCYFSNRVEPGTKRPKYTDPYQPLRNGDTGNIALAILGLPLITDSWFIPRFGEPPLVLELTKNEDVYKLTWWSPAQEFILEFADSINPAQNWGRVSLVFNSRDNWKTIYLLDTQKTNRFFRLKKIAPEK